MKINENTVVGRKEGGKEGRKGRKERKERRKEGRKEGELINVRNKNGDESRGQEVEKK